MIVPQQVAQKAQYAGASIATGSGAWLAANYQAIAAVGVLVGIAVGVFGLLINWYYLHKKSKGPPA